MVRRADPRGNPWARKKNWALRPTPLRTLRVLPAELAGERLKLAMEVAHPLRLVALSEP